MKLIFSSIKNGTIFGSEFQKLDSYNGTIEFKHKNKSGGIAVVYAPNGTGKSSFAKTVEAEFSTDRLSFVATDDVDMTITPERQVFHVIPDQINRNVIPGKETDYLIGSQIKREYELRETINTTFETSYTALANRYKNEFKVSRVSDYLLTQIETLPNKPYPTAFEFLRTIINKQAHSTDVDVVKFVTFIRDENNRPKTVQLDEGKRKWVIDDCGSKNSIIKRIINLDYHTVIVDSKTILIEQHDDAIGILKKYHDLDSCIVCDNNNFNGDALLREKTAIRNHIYDGLDQRTKELLDKILKDGSLAVSDPFNIKRIVREFIAGWDAMKLDQLQIELKNYVRSIGDEMIDILFQCFDGTHMIQDIDEYIRLVSMQPQLNSEELLFIEEIINESIGKTITIQRDPDSKNYKLKLGKKNLIGINRDEMELSSGEQNFISLAFELLMARHSDKQYVILDDPISSFDSVYKNKIAYCIIKFLEDKKQLVLTHNTDLIRLLDVQLNNCFNLYILNNVENGQNGFIPVSDREKKLLINLHELIKLFQNKDNSLIPAINNRRQFLMAMVPFMRGYAHISLDINDDFGSLSNIMHGYCTGSIDVVPIYKKLFGYDFKGTEIISALDILNFDFRMLDILNKTQYPLLAKTLEHSLVYYYLRMKVEKELVDDFNISTQEGDTLNKIIRRAFDCKVTDAYFEQKRDFRVFFTSRKTLLNEFNHFEGNMNIFQPAIDINPVALQKEIDGIEAKLVEVREFVRRTTS